MLSPVSGILRGINRPEKLNILTFPTHERYETLLAQTGHNFFSLYHPSLKYWRKDYAAVPENYKIFKEVPPLWLDIDLVLVQSKFGQYQLGLKYAREKGVTLMCLEHTLPLPGWDERYTNEIKKRTGDINIYISEYSKDIWGDSSGRVIHHGIDTDLFKPADCDKTEHVLSVVNDWINRDAFCGWSLYCEITKEGLPVNIVGDTAGLSKPAESVEALVREYQRASVFLNTSQVSPVPTSLLEAMSCGVPVVSTGTCMIPEFIENGVNGFMSDDPVILRGYCEMLLQNKNLAAEIGAAGRKTIEEKFSSKKFVENWKGVFKNGC